MRSAAALVLRPLIVTAPPARGGGRCQRRRAVLAPGVHEGGSGSWGRCGTRWLRAAGCPAWHRAMVAQAAVRRFRRQWWISAGA